MKDEEACVVLNGAVRAWPRVLGAVHVAMVGGRHEVLCGVPLPAKSPVSAGTVGSTPQTRGKLAGPTVAGLTEEGR